MISNPIFYLLAAPSVLLLGISKGGFGSGLGILVVPILALIVSPIRAAAILLPPLLLMDLVGLLAYRGQWDRLNMKIMVPAAILGSALGALTFRYTSERLLDLMVGVIAVGFTLQMWRGIAARQAPRRASWIRGSFWAGVSGFTSFVANAGGPPASIYLLPQQMDKTLYVGTTVIFFALVNWLKVAPYFWLGLLNEGNMLTSLVLLPLAPIGMGLGVWLHDRLDPVLFYRVCYGLLFFAGAKLIWDGLFASGGVPT